MKRIILFSLFTRTYLSNSHILLPMLYIVATSLLDDPIVSFAFGLIVVLVIGFALRGFLAKKK